MNNFFVFRQIKEKSSRAIRTFFRSFWRCFLFTRRDLMRPHVSVVFVARLELKIAFFTAENFVGDFVSPFVLREIGGCVVCSWTLAAEKVACVEMMREMVLKIVFTLKSVNSGKFKTLDLINLLTCKLFLA